MSWLCTLFAAYCSSGTLTGPARVIDGDTLAIGSQHVRLWGVDAEELDEPNGYAAKAHLIILVAGREVTCSYNGRSYNRVVGVCHVGADYTLNTRMVEDGFALDCVRYSRGLYATLEPSGARDRLKQKGYCR